MYQQQIEKINRDIERTGKVIISLGCSFVQGQGAVDDELYTNYIWEYEKLGVPLKIKLSDKEKKEMVKKYPSLALGPDGNIDFTFMEYDNAFVNVLCEKYLEGGAAAINLGIRGCGNRGSIKDLHFYPEINWDKVKETTVLYVPSGLERFDFVNDNWHDHHHWKCMWPHYKDVEDGPRKLLWQGYSENLHSDKFEVLEQLGHVQELKLWCQVHNAKLVITPGFDRRYSRKHFEKSLLKLYERNMAGMITSQSTSMFNKERLIRYAELFPWENMFEPEGCPTFVDLVMKQEHPDDWEFSHFFEYLGKGSPNSWITSCAHPSAKGHDLFAKTLYEFLNVK